MNTKTSFTWTATIWIAGDNYLIEDCCRRFVARGLCVSITPTQFVHTDGMESGAAVGLIRYPRFPRPDSELRDLALELCGLLIKACRQQSASVVMPTETVFIYTDEKEKNHD